VDARLRQTRAHGSDREQRLWAEETARLLDATASLAPAARATVIEVLRSLVDDPLESLETRRDAQALIDTINSRAPLETPLPNTNSQPTSTTTLRRRLSRALAGAA
jgi:hypothetical protein